MLQKESWEEKKIVKKLIPLLHLQFLNHGYLSSEKKPLLFTGIRSLRSIRISSFAVILVYTLFVAFEVLACFLKSPIIAQKKSNCLP